MKNSIAYSTLIFGVFALSTSAIFVKLATAPSSIIAFYRLLFALLVLVPFVMLKRENRQEMWQMPIRQIGLSMLAGAVLAVHYIMWFESLSFTSVASSTVIVSLQPVFSMLMGYLFLKEYQPRLAVIGCCIALLGSFIIGYGDFQSDMMALVGDILAFVAAGVISLYFFVGQNLRKSLSALCYTMLGYAGSVIFLALYAILKGDSFFGYSDLTWWSFLGLALVSTIMGQFIFNLLLKWLSATTISMAILGEPVGTILLAYLILNETISLRQGAGIVIIMVGIALYLYANNRKK